MSAASPYAFRSKDGKRVDVLIELFKNSGTPENRHGDVAVVVTFEGPGGLLIVDYAFLEAKRRYSGAKGRPRFEELGATQLKRILDNTPRAQVLLYGYDAIARNYNAIRDAENSRPIPTVHAVTLPINLTVALVVRNAALFSYSVPFACQLCYRYCQGLDLEMVGSIDELMARFEHSGPLPAFMHARYFDLC
jgi:hypothetical protein